MYLIGVIGVIRIRLEPARLRGDRDLSCGGETLPRPDPIPQLWQAEDARAVRPPTRSGFEARSYAGERRASRCNYLSPVTSNRPSACITAS